jgi:hypothetical protein
MDKFRIVVENIYRYNQEHEHVQWLRLGPDCISLLDISTGFVQEFWRHAVQPATCIKADQDSRIANAIRTMVAIWKTVILKWRYVTRRIEVGWPVMATMIDRSPDPRALAERLYTDILARHWLQAICLGLEAHLGGHIGRDDWESMTPIKTELESCDKLFDVQALLTQRMVPEALERLDRTGLLGRGELIAMFVEHAVGFMPAADLLSDDIMPFLLDVFGYIEELASSSCQLSPGKLDAAASTFCRYFYRFIRTGDPCSLKLARVSPHAASPAARDIYPASPGRIRVVSIWPGSRCRDAGRDDEAQPAAHHRVHGVHGGCASLRGGRCAADMLHQILRGTVSHGVLWVLAQAAAHMPVVQGARGGVQRRRPARVHRVHATVTELFKKAQTKQPTAACPNYTLERIIPNV